LKWLIALLWKQRLSTLLADAIDLSQHTPSWNIRTHQIKGSSGKFIGFRAMSSQQVQLETAGNDNQNLNLLIRLQALTQWILEIQNFLGMVN
jgi:hypothetical protein